MPCINPDRKPTLMGMALIELIRDRSLAPEEIAELSGRSIPGVRSGLRELKDAGFVEEMGGKYRLTRSGVDLLA
jgi:predicted transcriptional regulator